MITFYIRSTATTKNPIPTWHIRKEGTQNQTLCNHTVRYIGGLQDKSPEVGVCGRCSQVLKHENAKRSKCLIDRNGFRRL